MDPFRGVGVVGSFLLPGHEAAHEFELNKLYDMSAPGEYRVTLSCKHPRKKVSDLAPTIISNTIKMTVLGKQQ